MSFEAEEVNHGQCPRCSSQRTGPYWCQKCESKEFESKFHQWSSGDDKIDKLIRETQKNALTNCNYLEWIPHDHFVENAHLARGGFGVVSQAIWLLGPRQKINPQQQRFVRSGATPVAMKKLKRPKEKEISAEFLNELESYFEFTGKTTVSDSEWTQPQFILQSYGITKEPEGDYMIVMEYAKYGDLRTYIRLHHRDMSWPSRLDHLCEIAWGLYNIHEAGLFHGDFHSGNILKRREDISGIVIGDLGLTRRQGSKLETPNGLMTSLAPEVIAHGNDYKPSADVYSFGIIMWEMSSGKTPFINRSRGYQLILDIENGERPEIEPGTPKWYEDLMKQCWDKDPDCRPTAKELRETLKSWCTSEKRKEIWEAEKMRKKELKTEAPPPPPLPPSVTLLDVKKNYFEGPIYWTPDSMEDRCAVSNLNEQISRPQESSKKNNYGSHLQPFQTDQSYDNSAALSSIEDPNIRMPTRREQFGYNQTQDSSEFGLTLSNLNEQNLYLQESSKKNNYGPHLQPSQPDQFYNDNSAALSFAEGSNIRTQTGRGQQLGYSQTQDSSEFGLALSNINEQISRPQESGLYRQPYATFDAQTDHDEDSAAIPLSEEINVVTSLLNHSSIQTLDTISEVPQNSQV